MTKFEPRDPDFEAKVRSRFSRQTALHTLGTVLGLVEPGEVEIEMPYQADLTQECGVVHSGIVTSILDSACGYAAFTLSSVGTTISTVEYKVNFVGPAKGDRFLARGEVVRSGATVTVCKGNVLAYDGGEEKLVATMLITLMSMPN